MDSRDGDSPGRQEFTSSVDDSMEDKKDESQRSTGEDNETTDICRVCRAPGTSAEPLFHPCKCSGSMRFVHQACLEDWLRVSGRECVSLASASSTTVIAHTTL